MEKLFIHQVIDTWGPAVIKRIETIKSMLVEAGKTEWLQIVNELESTYLFDGFADHFRKMIPIPKDQDTAVFPIVFCHNDGQENNILAQLTDNTNLMLIDYEYGGWNPMAMDLANYINECMLDNAYPGAQGIGYYHHNCMTKYEIDIMTKTYMKRYFEKYMKAEVKAQYDGNVDTFITREFENLVDEIWICVKLNNFFWAVWGLFVINMDECASDSVWHYDFISFRMKMDKSVDKMRNHE